MTVYGIVVMGALLVLPELKGGDAMGAGDVIERMVSWDLEKVRAVTEARQDRGTVEAGRRTKRGPHEKGRVGRKVSISFPSAEWPEAVWELAERWRVRPCDVYTAAVAHFMEAVEAGRVEGPGNGGAQFWQRAGEPMDLPWVPSSELGVSGSELGVSGSELGVSGSELGVSSSELGVSGEGEGDGA